jgi:hypothetical protein
LCPQIGALSFSDDNFLGFAQQHKERGIEIAKYLYSITQGLPFEIACRADAVEHDTFRHLVDYGLSGVYLGIESGVQRILDLFNKGTTIAQNLKSIEVISELGIGCDIGFIMFCSTITVGEFHWNLTFLRHVLENYPVFVHPTCIFRSLRHYPKDLGQAAFVKDNIYEAPPEDVVNALRVSLETIWRERYQNRFLQLERSAIFNNHNDISHIQGLRKITLDMIDTGLEMVRELQKSHDEDGQSLARSVLSGLGRVE